MDPKPLRRGYYIDTDNTGDWLDLPEPRYGPDSKPFEPSPEPLERDPAKRRALGLAPLSALSSDITDR